MDVAILGKFHPLFSDLFRAERRGFFQLKSGNFAAAFFLPNKRHEIINSRGVINCRAPAIIFSHYFGRRGLPDILFYAEQIINAPLAQGVFVL